MQDYPNQGMQKQRAGKELVYGQLPNSYNQVNALEMRMFDCNLYFNSGSHIA